jgi:hypothetical protein
MDAEKLQAGLLHHSLTELLRKSEFNSVQPVMSLPVEAFTAETVDHQYNVAIDFTSVLLTVR